MKIRAIYGNKLTMLSKLAALALGLVMMGCSVPNIQSDKTIAAPPDSWQTPEHNHQSVTNGWLHSFASEELNTLVGEALTHNLDLKATQARRLAAIANARISAAAKYPTVDLATDIARTRSSTRPRGAKDNIVNYQTNLSLDLRASWEVDVWGKIRAQATASESDAAAADYDLGAARFSLAAQTTRAWFSVIEAKLQLVLAKQRVASFERTEGLVSRRFQRGLVDALDLRLTQTNLPQSYASLAERKNAFNVARRQLEVILGRYPAAQVEAQDALPIIDGTVPAGLPANLVLRRPDLRAAHARLYSAELRTEAAHDALLPSLNLTGSAGTSSTGDFMKLLNFDYLVVSLVAGLAQPIFQGGRLRADIKRNEALIDLELANYAGKMLVAFQEVEDTLELENSLEEQLRYSKDVVEQSKATEKAAERQYSRGLTQILELLNAQRSHLDAQARLLTLQRQRLDNRVNLFLALGGNFE